MLTRLIFSSMRARALTVVLAILTIAFSVGLVLAVNVVRDGTKASFANTISNTDLIVGARSGSVQLMLYTIFQIGNPTNNISWDSVQAIAARPEVDWLVPISLGDSHGEFRVMGTSVAFFERYRYRGGQSIGLHQGAAFTGLYHAVVGSDVAATLNYELGQEIVVSHGLASFIDHDDRPFKITGILERTGTPIDRTVLISLESMEVIHRGWRPGAGSPTGPEPAMAELQPKEVTAALVGIGSRLDIFNVQRWINTYPGEPLLAVLPGLTLQELWQFIGVAEDALRAVSLMVVGAALLGMIAVIFSGLNERRREMAILRAMGARPGVVFGLLLLEAVIMAGAGCLIGAVGTYGLLYAARPLIDAHFGIWLPMQGPGPEELKLLGGVMAAAGLASIFPAARAYQLSLADGLSIKN